MRTYLEPARPDVLFYQLVSGPGFELGEGQKESEREGKEEGS